MTSSVRDIIRLPTFKRLSQKNGAHHRDVPSESHSFGARGGPLGWLQGRVAEGAVKMIPGSHDYGCAATVWIIDTYPGTGSLAFLARDCLPRRWAVGVTHV